MALVDNLTSHTLMVENQRKIYELHEDILAQILVRLPVKYILRCMRVQKSWYYLIRTPMFITLHLNHQKSSTHKNNTYLFFLNLRTLQLVLRFDNVQCEEYLTIEKLPPRLSQLHWLTLTHLDWYALSYGLFCLKTWPLCRIYLWNPVIQKCKIPPKSPIPYPYPCYSSVYHMWEALAFGFVPGLNDYVLVQILKRHRFDEREPHPHSVIIAVYSLNTNSWKKLSMNNVLVHHINRESDVFVNDTAFWVGWNLDMKTVVMYFGTKTNILGQILLPEWASSSANPHIRIRPFGQSIACFVNRRNYGKSDDWNMWVLEGDPINEFSWKKRTFHLSEDVQGCILGVRSKGPFVESLVFLETEEKPSEDEANYVKHGFA